MLLPDVNVLVDAYREDAPEHASRKRWLDDLVSGTEPFGMSELVLSGFIRIVTHPRIFKTPTPVDEALSFARTIREQPTCVVFAPGVRHWEIFETLCLAVGATGNLVSDAYLAALAIESGSELITSDADFGRFPDMRWRRPW